MESLRLYVLEQYQNKDIQNAEELEEETFKCATERDSILEDAYIQTYMKVMTNISQTDPMKILGEHRESLNPDKWSKLYKARTNEEFKKRPRKGMHRCQKCKSWSTEHHQIQSSSADEPMTTHVVCLDCNHRWKFK